jgi:Mg-chelatase subunit ChlD
MPRKILTLGPGGKLALKSPDGKVEEARPGLIVPPLVYLLLDCSGSMAGEKIGQAKRGVSEFAENAFAKGYWLGLIKFESDASEVCGPTQDLGSIKRILASVNIGGSTNMMGAIRLGTQMVGSTGGIRCLVLFTDGMPDDEDSALDAAERAKAQGIEIITVGTEEADQEFLAKLATREDLATIVDSGQLQEGIAATAKLLPGTKK